MRAGNVACAVGILLFSGTTQLPGQVSVQGALAVGRAEHRVLDAGTIVGTSGTLLAGAVAMTVRDRIEVRGEAVGARFTASSTSSADDHDLAQVQLYAGLRVRPWLTMQGGSMLRTFTSPLARQRWTALLVGAEARVPLAFESVRGLLRGYWMPMVSVSGLPNPDIALAAGAGMEWWGRRIGASVVYMFERYDFSAAPATTKRPEELSLVQLRLSLRWPQSPRTMAP